MLGTAAFAAAPVLAASDMMLRADVDVVRGEFNSAHLELCLLLIPLSLEELSASGRTAEALTPAHTDLVS